MQPRLRTVAVAALSAATLLGLEVLAMTAWWFLYYRPLLDDTIGALARSEKAHRTSEELANHCVRYHDPGDGHCGYCLNLVPRPGAPVQRAVEGMWADAAAGRRNALELRRRKPWLILWPHEWMISQ